MKKILALFTLITICFSFSACGCEHNWIDATCQSPKTCSLCEKTQGKNDPSQHAWKDATCITPKTCTICNINEGDVSSSHAYEGDKCKDCGIIQLTLDNYENYFECNAQVKTGETIGNLICSLICSCKVMGNSHFKFNDVYITIKFTHYNRDNYQQYLVNNVLIAKGEPVTTEAAIQDEETCTIKLNIAGNGETDCRLWTNYSKNASECFNFKNLSNQTRFSVVNISGTIQEY